MATYPSRPPSRSPTTQTAPILHHSVTPPCFSFACLYYWRHRCLLVATRFPMLNPKRTVAELKERRALTADENGAQRVAFTETWSRARGWLREKLQALPVEIHSDPAR